MRILAVSVSWCSCDSGTANVLVAQRTNSARSFAGTVRETPKMALFSFQRVAIPA